MMMAALFFQKVSQKSGGHLSYPQAARCSLVKSLPKESGFKSGEPLLVPMRALCSQAVSLASKMP